MDIKSLNIKDRTYVFALEIIKLESILKENEELIKILTSIVKKLQKSICFFLISYFILHISYLNLFAAISFSDAAVMDNNGVRRTNFSNTETIILWQKVYNSATSASMINFTFYILNPNGAVVFTHTGNATIGTAGYAESQISGINISRFYSVPGEYTFRAQATLESETVNQEVKFIVASPNITLIYPPYGARNLSDKPLIFRWVSSGASKYRISVADNAGMHNPVHSYTNNGETSYTYPEEPTQPREQLTPGAVYYWKIEGLDFAGNVIAESLVYNFSVKSESVNQSRNIKVDAISISGAITDWKQPVNFKVNIANVGNTTENNVAVKLTLGGMEANDSPKQIAILSPSQTSEIPFTAFMPENQEQALAVACVDIFDDNIPDNCKTFLLSKSSYIKPKKKLSYDEMWEALKQRLGIENIEAIKDYDFLSIICPSCEEGELSDLIAGLTTGESRISGVFIEGESEAGITPIASTDIGATSLGNLDMKIEFFTELSGWTSAFENKEALTLVVKNRKEWNNVWKKLFSDKDVPEVDFDKNMIILVVSAPSEKADFIRIMGSRKSEGETIFDYYVVESSNQITEPAYILKSVQKEEGNVKFNRVNMGR